MFIWLLSTISKLVLPCVLSCKYAFEVWDKIHIHFNAYMRAQTPQLRIELKSMKKGKKSINEYVLRVNAIENSLLVV